MLKIIVKDGENIERALKRYKRKHRNIKVMQNLRETISFLQNRLLKDAGKYKKRNTYKP